MFYIIADYVNKNFGNIFINFIHKKVNLSPIIIMYSPSISRSYSTQEELDDLV